MSTTLRIGQALQRFYQLILSTIDFVAAPVIRIFKPADRNYPATGVQPYEGDPNRTDR
uniref:Nicotinate phosphoribosyltransferase n=1 Tax=Cyanothece sp. (strain PCC 7425 / ATCC 29141) TaxID=395961 RepID=B8HNN6_CYAP4